MVSPPRCRAVLPVLLLPLLAAAASAAALLGDLDGDGRVGPYDEALLIARWGATPGSALYDSAADLDLDGKIGLSDLAILVWSSGNEGGEVDTTPPDLFVTLNDIPADENRLLVVPPDHFRITLEFRGGSGSLIDPASLRVTSSEAIGPFAPGTDLAPQFSVTPARAVWEVPAGSNLARTSHFLSVSVRDLAGNEARQTYGFAVRDFGFGAPLGDMQVVFLDFDRRGDGEQDFKASLRELGLSTAANAALEQQIVDRLRADIVGRVHQIYGRNPDGTPGPDPVNILFTWFDPQIPHTTLCIGGTHPTTPEALGAAPLDLDNLVENENWCASEQYGVFPHAIAELWGDDQLFQHVFWPLLSAHGGTPVGESPLDAVVLAPGFDPGQATPAQRVRQGQIHEALDAFAQIVAVGAAHEVGHTLGLAAPGPAPAGLFGGTSGTNLQHDVTASGATPAQNFIMKYGGAFSFAAITGRQGYPKPYFRPIDRAYLTNRLVRNAKVASLEPRPVLSALTPNPVSYGGGESAVLTLHGEHLSRAEFVELKGSSPGAAPLLHWSAVDDQTLTGELQTGFVPPGVYRVRVTNDDEQFAELGGLEVLP